MDPKFIEAAKFVLGWSASLGASRIVSTFANSVPRENVIDKVTVPVGGFALASLVGMTAKKHMEEQIDSAVEAVEKYQETQKNKTQ
jgi:hypothetical protein